MKKQMVFVLGVLVFLQTMVAARDGASFQGLGDLPGGYFSSSAYGVSADGLVVVGRSKSASGTESFRWVANDGMIGLGDLDGGSFFGGSTGASADGAVVVGFSKSSPGHDDNKGEEAFRWTEADDMVGLGTLGGDHLWSCAYGVNADGSVVVGWSGLEYGVEGREAFRWATDGGMVGLGDLDGGEFYSWASDVSADGSVVVGASKSASGAEAEEAFRWTVDGDMVGLGRLEGSSNAYAVSAVGSVVVGASGTDSRQEAFRWTEESGMVGLGDLPGSGFWSTAFDVSADGSVVVGHSESASAGSFEAFIWDEENGIRSLRDVLVNDYGLDLTGWTLMSATGISDDGRTIVGYGFHPDNLGNPEAWVVRLPGPQVVYVDAANGNDNNDGLSPETAFATIQKGIDTAIDGDTVIVADGTYTGNGNRDLDFGGKAITVRSENGPENCIIDCNGTEAEHHRGFYFHSGEGADSVLEGFTITNGYADGNTGGGIYCSRSHPTISNCIIRGNVAPVIRVPDGIGGGMLIFNNGAGIGCYKSSPTIRNCYIVANRATGAGGGISLLGCTNPVIRNCVITGNIASHEDYGRGGAIYSHSSSPTVSNCTVSGNLAGKRGGGIYCVYGGGGPITNSIFWSNTPDEINAYLAGPVVLYSNVQGGWPGEGNIDVDPCFVDPGYWDPNGTSQDPNDDFWVDGDYHLKSQGGRWDPNSQTWVQDELTSPCIDAGNPGCPLGSEPNEPNNIRINMGAYGGTAEASKSPEGWAILADLTNDYIVDINDLEVFVRYWLEAGRCIPSDLNRNQFVDFNDFALLAADRFAGSTYPPISECRDWQTLHPEWIFCDDFEDGTPLVRQGRYFEYNDDDGDFIPMAGVGLDGSVGMRVLWQNGEVPAGNLKLGFGRVPISYFDKGIRPHEDFREIYYRMYLKMQDGWQGNPYKLSRAMVVASDLWWSTAMTAFLGDGSGYVLGIDALRCVDENDQVITDPYGDGCDWLGHVDGITPIFDSQHDDTWYCIEAHVKLNDPGLSNGVQEFWINGQLEARMNNLNFVRSYTDYAINAIFFENFWNSGSPQTQGRYFDNIVVSTEPIGPRLNPGNRPPIADAGPDITVYVDGYGASCCVCLDIREVAHVVMDGSNSYDPNGDTLIYIWQAPIPWLLSGIGCYDGVVEAANPTGEFPVGSTTVTLTVSDGELTDTDSLVVTVLPLPTCSDNSECGPGFYCAKAAGDCDGVGTCRPKPDACIALYDPVCGCDGQTYSNDCVAAAFGVNVAYYGECVGY